MQKPLSCHFSPFAADWSGRCNGHLLAPGSCDCVTFHGKREFRQQIEVRLLRDRP